MATATVTRGPKVMKFRFVLYAFLALAAYTGSYYVTHSLRFNDVLYLNLDKPTR